MSTRDETHAEFAWPTAEEAEAENAAQAPGTRIGTTGPGRLRNHPELQRAAAISHFDRAIQRIRENDAPSARLEAEAALRILGGED